MSVLTPASRYAEPFVDCLAARSGPMPELRIGHGKGRFGRQVASGAEAYARRNGFDRVIAGPTQMILAGEPAEGWVLFTAGTFEGDISALARARGLARPATLTCAVAAGVADFAEAAGNPDGTFGIAQWFPGSRRPCTLGPDEEVFLDAYHAAAGEAPGYPAMQAFAAALLAAHCARQAESTDRAMLWQYAEATETTTAFGPFVIDPGSGAQTAHGTVLVRWIGRERVPIWGMSS